MSEAPTFRDELEEIYRFFGDKKILTVSDVSTYLGKTRDWTRDTFGVTTPGITAVGLAHKMVEFNR